MVTKFCKHQRSWMVHDRAQSFSFLFLFFHNYSKSHTQKTLRQNKSSQIVLNNTKSYCTRNSVHYSCPRFWYPVYWTCIEYKDCVYNCSEINVWSLLLTYLRRWRSSKATKQTRNRRCRTFKCCKMLLEDEGDETRPRGCKYPTPYGARLLHIIRDDRARLVSSNWECFAHYKHISYFVNKYSLSLYV